VENTSGPTTTPGTEAEQDDTFGYAVAVYEGDYGNKARPQPGTLAGAVGHDLPAGVVQEVRNAELLVRLIISSPWPF
jgi:hypothetical protein